MMMGVGWVPGNKHSKGKVLLWKTDESAAYLEFSWGESGNIASTQTSLKAKLRILEHM